MQHFVKPQIPPFVQMTPTSGALTHVPSVSNLPQKSRIDSFTGQSQVNNGVRQSMAYSNVFPQPTSRNESVIQYVPYQREVTEYVTQEIVEYVPVQRKITEYYAVQHDVEYQPKLVTNKYVEYVPVERCEQTVEYYPVERHTVISQPQIVQENLNRPQINPEVKVSLTQSGYLQPSIVQPSIMRPQAAQPTIMGNVPLRASFVQPVTQQLQSGIFR